MSYTGKNSYYYYKKIGVCPYCKKGVPIRVIKALKSPKCDGYTCDAVLEIIENRLDRLRRSF